MPTAPGLTATDMIDAAHAGDLDALISSGGNFLEVLPDPGYCREALARLKLRVHIDIVLSSQMLVPSEGDVLLLPAQTRYEMTGGVTETSTERRIIFSPEIEGPRIGEAWPEWKIFGELARRVKPELDEILSYSDTAELRAEIGRVVSLYAGIEGLHEGGDSFQYGGPRLPAGSEFPTASGRAHFSLVVPTPPLPADGLFAVSARSGKQFNTACRPRGLPWLERVRRSSASRRSSAWSRLLVALGVDGRAAERRRAAGAAGTSRRWSRRLAAIEGRRGSLADHQQPTCSRRRRRRPGRPPGSGRVNVSMDSPRPRPLLRDRPARRAAPGCWRGPGGDRRLPRGRPRSRCNADARCATSTEDEVLRCCDLARASRVPGPLHRVHAARRRPRLDAPTPVLTEAEAIRELIEAIHVRCCELPRRAARDRTRLRLRRRARARSAFVNPVSEPFCADCNRIRLTADGRLRTCLFSLHETDLRGPLREGAGDAELETIVRNAVWQKELKHHVGERGFRQPARTMSAIGG